MLRRINFKRFYFLIRIKKKNNNYDYFYVKKNKKNQNYDMIYSSYDNQLLNTENIIMQNLDPLLQQTFKNHNIQEKNGYYITNVITGEYLNCFDFIWNGSFCDICKHYHSVRIFVKSLENYDDVVNETKEQLIIYFKNKQKVLLPELKNYNIYQGDIETAFQEIIKEYNEKGK